MNEVKPPRQRLSTEERQDEIVKAAVELGGTLGVDNVTTQEIAHSIGLTQGAIFRHFPTKDTIWIAVVHWIRGRLMSVVDRAASQASGPVDALERIFLAHLAFAEKHAAAPRLLLSANPLLKQLLQEMLAGYEARISALLAQAKTEGLVRADLDEGNAASLYTAMIQGLIVRILVLGTKRSLLSEARRVFPIFLDGIGAVAAETKQRKPKP